jgi:hypothetical protein
MKIYSHATDLILYSVIVWDCVDNHNHINDYAGYEKGQHCQNRYADPNIY